MNGQSQTKLEARLGQQNLTKSHDSMTGANENGLSSQDGYSHNGSSTQSLDGSHGKDSKAMNGGDAESMVDDMVTKASAAVMMSMCGEVGQQDVAQPAKLNYSDSMAIPDLTDLYDESSFSQEFTKNCQAGEDGLMRSDSPHSKLESPVVLDLDSNDASRRRDGSSSPRTDAQKDKIDVEDEDDSKMSAGSSLHFHGEDDVINLDSSLVVGESDLPKDEEDDEDSDEDEGDKEEVMIIESEDDNSRASASVDHSVSNVNENSNLSNSNQNDNSISNSIEVSNDGDLEKSTPSKDSESVKLDDSQEMSGRKSEKNMKEKDDLIKDNVSDDEATSDRDLKEYLNPSKDLSTRDEEDVDKDDDPSGYNVEDMVAKASAAVMRSMLSTADSADIKKKKVPTATLR